jgi:hypothetical protein
MQRQHHSTDRARTGMMLLARGELITKRQRLPGRRPPNIRKEAQLTIRHTGGRADHLGARSWA